MRRSQETSDSSSTDIDVTDSDSEYATDLTSADGDDAYDSEEECFEAGHFEEEINEEEINEEEINEEEINEEEINEEEINEEEINEEEINEEEVIGEEMKPSEDESQSVEDDSDEDRPPEFYVTHVNIINRSAVVQKGYSPATNRAMDDIEALWHQYCSFVKERRQVAFKTATLGDLSGFFRWKLDQKRGKNGRKLRGTKLASSLGTDWKIFRLVFERATEKRIKGKINRQMHKILHSIAKDYNLSNQKREKASMDVEDVGEVLQTALTTTEKRFQVGRYRILTCFFLQGAFTTANRPAALLNLQYKHLLVTLMRNPAGGHPRILLEFTFEFTKTYLGMKDANTFPIPEIIFDPSLILSPHVFLLGLMFADDVFLAPKLKRAEDLSKLHIQPGRHSLPIPLKPDKGGDYVFRQCERTLHGWQTSKDKLPTGTIRPWIKTLGEIAGFSQVARPYCLRYGAGKAFDDNGNVSDSLRNLMMQHAKTETFLNHYLDRRVNVDTQAIVRGLTPQTELMRAACRMSRWIDPDRPRQLTPEQSASVNDDPSIIKLVDRRVKLKGKASQVEKYDRLGRQISNTRQRLRYALRMQIRREWDQEQAVRIIEQQLSGVDFQADVEAKLSLMDDRTPEHDRLIESILSLPGSDLDEEFHRRNAAINAVAACCEIEEGPFQRRTRASRKIQPPERTDTRKVPSPIDTAKKKLEVAITSVCKEKRPTICFLCLGNEKLSIDQRVYSFRTSGDLSKHFNRKHLRYMNATDAIVCPICKVPLKHRMHLQSHAYTIHGTVSKKLPGPLDVIERR